MISPASNPYDGKLKRICAAGEKLAAQIGGAFTIDPRKLADFRRREDAR